MSPKTKDKQLVLAARDGDPEAISRLYETFFPKLVNYGALNLGNARSAEDFAGDVMLSVLESLPRYKVSPAPFSAWVFRIARNRLIDASRRGKRRPTCSLTWDLPAETHTHEQVEHHFARLEIRQAVERLPFDQRDVILLRFYGGCDTATTARILGRTEASVKSLRFRGLRTLRQTVAGETSPTPLGV